MANMTVKFITITIPESDLKYLFIILVLPSSLFLFSSTKVIFEELDSLLVKNGWSLFQNSLLSEICLMFKLLVNGFF